MAVASPLCTLAIFIFAGNDGTRIRQNGSADVSDMFALTKHNLANSETCYLGRC